MAPKHKAPAAAGPASKKAKLGAEAWWEYRDGDKWLKFEEADSAMLEGKFKEDHQAVFSTKDFSFNQTYKTQYEVDFKKMVQRNKSSKTNRAIRRRALSEPKAQWEWWNDHDSWSLYNVADAQLLEEAFSSSTGEGMLETKDLSFNKGFDSLYIFDFTVMTQVNTDSGTSRKIQRTAAGVARKIGHTKGEDDGYFDFLVAAGAAPTDGKAPGLVFELGLPPAVVTAQTKLGPQSLRKSKKIYGKVVEKDAHGSMCFDRMLEMEQKFCGEWAVFYHSYSAAAILYEVQAVVAAVLFRFKAEFAGLPRILAHGFKHIPDAPAMLKEFPTWADRDHNPAFKAVGLCATSGLLAPDAEAPATKVFLSGYSVGCVDGVLQKLLGACGVPEAQVDKMATDIVKLAVAHGLDTGGIAGGSPCKSGRSGHLLQIFLRRELVDQFVYAALPFGVPDTKRAHPLSKHLAGPGPIRGQVRITLNPDVFFRTTYARMFTYSADSVYYVKRSEFIEGLKELLEPVLSDKHVRTKAARGIFGGDPPEWWTAEDQSELAAMAPARYMSAH